MSEGEETPAPAAAIEPIPVQERPVSEMEYTPPPPPPDSMIVCVTNIREFLASGKAPTAEILASFRHIIHHLTPFHYYHSVSMQVRKLLFVLTECAENANAMKYVASRFAMLQDLLIDMVPSSSKLEVLENLVQTIQYDMDCKAMDYSWRHQYAFDENVFNCDEHLMGFVDKFFATVTDDSMWKQFRAFEVEIVNYITEQYGIAEAPQLKALASRALSQKWFLMHPMFPFHQTDPDFVTRVGRLRRMTGEKLGIKETFLPPGAFQTPVKNSPGLYKRTISECNLLPYQHLPDDLFRVITRIHEFLYEELVQICYTRSKDKMSLAEFRPTVTVGSEDIMPILVMALALAEVPNLGDIVAFFDDYSMQIEDNTKNGLYVMNISTAYNAIMDPSALAEDDE